MNRRVSSPILVGRDADLAALLRALDACADDERTVALVTGDAGIGKTRLLRELAAAAGASSIRRVVEARGTCVRMADVDVPFGPLPAILDDIAAASSSPAVAQAVAEARLTLLAPATESSTGNAVGANGPEREGLLRLRLFERVLGVVRLVLAGGADRLLLVLDDAHWADPATLDLFAFLARRVRRSGALLVIACRGEALLADGPLQNLLLDLERDCVVERVDLAPLTSSEIRRQVAAIEGAGGGSAHDPDWIAARSEGNPFFAEELLRLPSVHAAVPDSLRDILRSRLAQLDPTARGLLAVLSVIGRPASRRELASASDLSDDVREQAIRSATEAGILVEADERIAFRHSLLSEAVRNELTEALAVTLHGRVAAALAADPIVRRTPAQMLEVAGHLDLAGEAELALPALVAGAEAAHRASAWSAAAAAFERAGELASPGGEGFDPLDLWRRAAWSWLDASDPQRAIRVSRRLARLARRLRRRDAWLVAWTDIATLQNEAGDVDRGYRLVERIAMLSLPDDRVAALRVDLGIGAVVALAGPDLRARERLTSVRARATELGMATEAALATSLLSHIAAAHGDPDTAVRLVDEALVVAPRDTPDALEALLINHAVDACALGEWTRARDAIDRLRRSATSFGADHQPMVLSYLAVSDAELALRTGDLAGCLRAVGAGAGISARLHAFHSLRAKEANAAALAGDTARAAAVAEAGLRHAAWCWWDRSMLRCSQALAQLAEGRLDTARDTILRAIEIPQADWQPQSDAAHLALVAVRIAAAQGAGAGSTAAIEWARHSADFLEGLAVGRAREGDLVPPVNRARGLLGVAEWRRALGIHDAAAWREALTALDAAGLRHEAAHARLQLARVLLAGGQRRDEPTTLLAAAVAYARIAPAAPLEGEVLALARAARIAIPDRRPLDAAPAAAAPGDPAPTAPGRPRDPWRLSGREREVLALVAEGRSNREIAEALFITSKTASSHVTHILDKLGVSSRVEAALLAARAGLVSGGSGGADQASPDGREASGS